MHVFHGSSGSRGGPRTVPDMRRDRYAWVLVAIIRTVRRRQMCHRTLPLSCQSGAELAQLSCWRAEAKPVGASATEPPDRRQPARPGTTMALAWIMDARCHACRQAGCFSLLHRMHSLAYSGRVLPPTEKQQQQRQPTRRKCSLAYLSL
jgi:hypothetical protein